MELINVKMPGRGWLDIIIIGELALCRGDGLIDEPNASKSCLEPGNSKGVAGRRNLYWSSGVS